jgi:sialate O-acetylesterase
MNIEHGILPGQVLQRLKGGLASATVTGTCETNGPVLATIASGSRALKGWQNRSVGRSTDGKFTAKLNGIPTGGPYTVTLAASKEKVSVQRVSVGDVWLLGGQSNMQGCGNMSGAPAPHPKVHAFYMDRRWDVAREPIHFLSESPDPVHNATPLTPEALKRLRKTQLKGVGLGIPFGKEMLKRSRGVPQGLICTAHGGTSMQQWSPEKKNEGGNSLYGSMLLSVRACGQPVAGMLWYQGESDSGEADSKLYTQRMQELVAEIRSDLKQPTMPFILVQIGRFFGHGNENGQFWNSIQAQEATLKEKIKYLECVSAIDLPLDDGIHIGAEGYLRLGVRMARMADRLAYGNKKELPPPELVSIKETKELVVKGTCSKELKFKNVVGGLRSAGEASGFALIDKNHNDMRAIYKTVLRGDTVRIETSLPELSDVRLMYGAGFAPTTNITDGRDMPIPVFGPIDCVKLANFTSYVTDWLVSGILPIERKIDAWETPVRSNFALEKKSIPGTFTNMHDVWQGKPGQAVFFTQVNVPEDMELKLCFGYDGPARVWLNGESIFVDMAGTNPAIPDKVKKALPFKKGPHELAVAMDLNGGLAWGFFMRFERTGLGKKELKEKTYTMPTIAPSA